MKKIKIILVSLMLIAFVSCDQEDAPINNVYDVVNGQSLVSFDKSGSNFGVLIDDAGTLDVVVNVTTVSSTERTVTVALDAENSSAATENYTFSNTVVIPANEYQGILTISGVDNSLETEAETIVFTIDAFTGGNPVLSSQPHTVSIFQVCPVPETFFVGDYLIEEISTISPGNGVALSNNTVVSVFIPEDDDGNPIETQRAFATEAFPMFCGGSFFDFEINLVCNELIVPLGRTTCSCGGNFDDYWGPASVNTTYDVDAGDDVLEVNFSDDVQDACGGGTSTVTYRFTKQ